MTQSARAHLPAALTPSFPFTLGQALDRLTHNGCAHLPITTEQRGWVTDQIQRLDYMATDLQRAAAGLTFMLQMMRDGGQSAGVSAWFSDAISGLLEPLNDQLSMHARDLRAMVPSHTV